jgi:MoaA/NifB/PqqE/SkfB family radical SAM enzyme
LYKYERNLINYIKNKLETNTNLSLHTNGILALEKIDIFNSYDKASISLPSFNLKTYEIITKTRKKPNIKKIIKKSKIPLKLSMLITHYNIKEIPDYIKKSSELGIKRIAVRKLKGREKYYPIEKMDPFYKYKQKKEIFGWSVYNISSIEVTICDFTKSKSRGLFLFSDGRLGNNLV